jgi:hypothetical protein
MFSWDSGDNLVWATGSVGEAERRIVALLESIYCDEVSLLWFSQDRVVDSREQGRFESPAAQCERLQQAITYGGRRGPHGGQEGRTAGEV